MQRDGLRLAGEGVPQAGQDDPVPRGEQIDAIASPGIGGGGPFDTGRGGAGRDHRPGRRRPVTRANDTGEGGAGRLGPGRSRARLKDRQDAQEEREQGRPAAFHRP